jgi:phosphoserine phosphatase RsbU/P
MPNNCIVTTGITTDEVHALERRLEDTSSRLHDLSTMGTLIASILDIESVLSVVMEMAVRMVEGEVGLILLQENEELISKIAWGADEALVRSIIYKDGEDVVSYAFKRQTPVVMNNFDQVIENGPVIDSLIAIPINSRSRSHGVIVIINKTTGGQFGDEDKATLQVLINFAAVAIDNSILLKESLEKQKIEQELSIAKQVQEAILPDNDGKINGVEIGTLYIPARQVSGDFYDIIKINDDEFMIVIGDVTDKGVPAAMVMSASTAIIMSLISESPHINPSDLMNHLNNILCDGIIKSQSMFVTLFIARYNLRENKLIYCNAGHLPPLYWLASQKKVLELKLGGTFVGQFRDISFQQGEVDIGRNDRLFAFTDGLSETADIHGDIFGLDRVFQVFEAVKELPIDEFCPRVKEWMDRFREGTSEDDLDDLTILQIRLLRETK